MTIQSAPPGEGRLAWPVSSLTFRHPFTLLQYPSPDPLPPDTVKKAGHTGLRGESYRMIGSLIPPFMVWDSPPVDRQVGYHWPQHHAGPL